MVSLYVFFFLMIRRPPRSTRTYTPLPHTTVFPSRGYPLDANRILLQASTSEAYGFLFKLLCDPGDEVLVPRPGYPLFEFLAGLESVRVRSYADRKSTRLNSSH